MENLFLHDIHKKDIHTENGSLSNSSTGNPLVDQFAKAPAYRGRTLAEVFNDQKILDSYNEEYALRFVFYLRMISRIQRKPNDEQTKKVQKGQGVRDEAFKRYIWYWINKPSVFYQNIHLFPIVGSWKDLLQIVFITYKENISIDINMFFYTIQTGLINSSTRELVKKYIPSIRSNNKCTTEWAKFTNLFAKGLANYLYKHDPNNINSKDYFGNYRKMKSTGTEHYFQTLITTKNYDELMNRFFKIPGKALMNLTKGDFFERHNLTEILLEKIKYSHTLNFTGYVYELGKMVNSQIKPYKKAVIDKQFNSLIELSKESINPGILGKRNVICAIDRSGSMQATVGNTTAMNIAESLGIYFSTLMEGEFHNWVIAFSHRSKWVKLEGESFVDRKLSMAWMDCPSNTDWISVIDSIVNKRKENPNIPLKDFPNTVITISDMQFDKPNAFSLSGNTNTWILDDNTTISKTNFETAKQKLIEVFPQEWVNDFQFIWWNVNSRYPDYPATCDDGGCYMYSGFDGSIITLLLGGDIKENRDEEKPDMLKVVEKALNQEILQFVDASDDLPF
jgi:hypothetical protein